MNEQQRNETRSHTRRVFDETFKRNAVQITLKGDRTIRQVADQLDITESLLHVWRRKFAPAPSGASSGGGELTPEQKDEEINLLRAEIVRMREREMVLKKSLGAGEWIRRALGIAVLFAVAAIAFGWDSSVLTRWSYAQIEKMKGEHGIELLCELLGATRSGYYRWRAQTANPRQQQDAVISARIAVHHRASRGNYGAPRIVADLREEGICTGRRRCSRLMEGLGVRGRKKHRRKPRTTDSRHDKPVAPNLLAVLEKPTAPNQIWVTDITYLDTAEGWLYLAVVLDVWSRRVVGWACAPTLASALVIFAFQDALKRRHPSPGVVHHSDRGSQYVDTSLIEILDQAGVARSMSRAANCYDNATIESFWSSLKTETQMDLLPPPTRHDAKLAVFDYIETFYNPKRRHSSLGYLSPVAFEKQKLNNIKAA